MALGKRTAHPRHPAAGDDGGALFNGLAVVAQHLVPVLGGDQRTEAHAGLLGRTDLQRLGLGLECGDEFVEDRALHIDALGAQADLTAVFEWLSG